MKRACCRKSQPFPRMRKTPVKIDHARYIRPIKNKLFMYENNTIIISICDLSGSEVKQAVNEKQNVGEHFLSIKHSWISGGQLYCCVLCKWREVVCVVSCE